MKRNTKYIPIILSIFLIIFTISFVLEDKTSFECTSTFEEQPMIYITEYGNCYHSVDCHYLRQSKIEKGLYEAKANGYMECSYCHGCSKSVIRVELIKYYERNRLRTIFWRICFVHDIPVVSYRCVAWNFCRNDKVMKNHIFQI